MEIPDQLIAAFNRSRRTVVLTGAGISAESGIPTFREAQTGLWAKYDPQKLATPHAFRENPRLVWQWYQWRRGLIESTQPNAGHYALVEFEQRMPAFQLITQNIDGLHRMAGSRNVNELHGNIHRTRCFSEGTRFNHWVETQDVPPSCPDCGGLLRPDVVWFGESLPRDQLENALQAAREAELFLSVGTSAVVQPAASLPSIAADCGAMVVEINIAETPLTSLADFALRGSAAEVLPALSVRAFGASTE